MSAPDWEGGPPPGYDQGIVQPYSYDAEQGIIGALLLNNSAMPAADALSENDFYRADHRLIFSKIRSLVAAGELADVVTVADAMTAERDAETFGGLAYLGDLANAVVSARPETVSSYAQIILRYSLKRSLQKIALDTARRAGNGVDVEELIAMTRLQVDSVSARLVQDDSEESKRVRLMSHGDFMAASRPADWIVNGLIQRGCLYACTAPTNHGKTAIMLVLMLCIAAGRRFCGIELQRSRVMILCGENEDGFRIRMRATQASLGIDDDDLAGWLMIYPRAGALDWVIGEIAHDAYAFGEIGAILIDTSVAYFGGDKEDDNVQALNHARTMRTLTAFPGRPAVIANSHPPKAVTEREGCVPRGGSSFINEIDSNLSVWAENDSATLHWTRKKRGPDFEPIAFEFVPVTMTDCGIEVQTMYARWIDDKREEALRHAVSERDMLVLRVMRDNPNASLARLCKLSGMVKVDGEPMKSSLQRVLRRLESFKLVGRNIHGWHITKAGKEESFNP